MKFTLIVDDSKPEEVVATVHQTSALTDEIEALIRKWSGNDRIAAYRDEDMQLLAFGDIACFIVEDGKTYAINKKKERLQVKLRLYELEQILPASFIRINKSAIANENHIERFAANFSGAVDAVFKCGYREYVSRRCLANIKRRYFTK